MKIKREVKKLCLEFIKEETGSERWEEIENELTRKWRFTPFSLLALFSNPPTIEYNDENFSLVHERHTNVHPIFRELVNEM